MAEKELWCFAESDDAESWDGPCDSREEAEAECRDNYGDPENPADVVIGYVSRGRLINAGDAVAHVIHADDLIQSAEEYDDETFACFDDSTLELLSGAQEALEQAMREWASRYVSTQGRWVIEGEAFPVVNGKL